MRDCCPQATPAAAIASALERSVSGRISRSQTQTSTCLIGFMLGPDSRSRASADESQHASKHADTVIAKVRAPAFPDCWYGWQPRSSFSLSLSVYWMSDKAGMGHRAERGGHIGNHAGGDMSCTATTRATLYIVLTATTMTTIDGFGDAEYASFLTAITIQLTSSTRRQKSRSS